MFTRIAVIALSFFSQNVEVTIFQKLCGEKTPSVSHAVGRLHVYKAKRKIADIACTSCLIDLTSVLTSHTCISLYTVNDSDHWVFATGINRTSSKYVRAVTKVYLEGGRMLHKMHGDFAIMKVKSPINDFAPLLLSTKVPKVGSELHIFYLGRQGPLDIGKVSNKK